MDNLGYLFAAYSTVWIFLFIYLVTLARRNRALEREVEELRELVRQQTGR